MINGESNHSLVKIRGRVKDNHATILIFRDAKESAGLRRRGLVYMNLTGKGKKNRYHRWTAGAWDRNRRD